MGQSPDGKSYNDEEIGFPLLNGAADYKGNVFNPNQYTSQPTNIAVKGDILIGIRATIGNIGLSDKDYCIGRGVAAIRPLPDKVNTSYLIHAIKISLNALIQSSAGSTIKGIKKEVLTEMTIPLPPLPIQEKIAEVLDKADNLRQKYRLMLERYDQLAQSVFLEMFGDPVRNEKNNDLMILNDFCLKITDGTHDTPGRLKEGVKFITGKHIKPFFIDFENSDYVDPKVHFEIYRRCNPEFNDILYTNIGVNIGTAARNTVNYEFSMKNVALLKLDSNKSIPRYVEHCLNFSSMKQEIIRISSVGGAQQFLSLAQIKSLSIPIPELNDQRKFNYIIERIEHNRFAVKLRLDKSETLFQGILLSSFKKDFKSN